MFGHLFVLIFFICFSLYPAANFSWKTEVRPQYCHRPYAPVRGLFNRVITASKCQRCFSLMFFSLPPDRPKVVFSPLSYLCCALMSAKVLLTGVTLLNLQMTHLLCLASIMWIQKCPSAIAPVFICPSGSYTSINIFAALLVTSWP